MRYGYRLKHTTKTITHIYLLKKTIMKQFRILTTVFLILVTTALSAQKKEKPSPEFKEMYFENMDGERITSARVEDKIVYLVVETANAIGEKVKLRLDEEDGDYIYQGKYLSANDEIEFKIKSEIQKMKFIIYNESIKKHRKLKEKAEQSKK